MKKTTVRIAGRDFRLAFTLDAQADMEDMIAGFDISKVADYAKQPRQLADMIFAMARQGELLDGRTLDVGRAWLGSHMSPAPSRVAGYQIAAMNALADGLTMETESDDDDLETDVALEEVRKKDPADARPTE